jgi:hypothetical protein
MTTPKPPTDTDPVVFVGGPHDGELGVIPCGRHRWLFPVMPDVTAELGAPYSPPTTVGYRLRLDETGYPSRRDDGRLIFELEAL